MELNVDNNRFILYRYRSAEPLLVAVAVEYLPKIELALKEFGSFKKVPSDWEVRGIFMNVSKDHTGFDPNTPQSEIVMNLLQDYELSS